MPPGEHVPVKWIREHPKMLVAPIPLDAERNLFGLLLPQRVDVAHALYGLYAAEVLTELRCHVDGKIVLCAARAIHC